VTATMKARKVRTQSQMAIAQRARAQWQADSWASVGTSAGRALKKLWTDLGRIFRRKPSLPWLLLGLVLTPVFLALSVLLVVVAWISLAAMQAAVHRGEHPTVKYKTSVSGPYYRRTRTYRRTRL
jgi:hypothetical protein